MNKFTIAAIILLCSQLLACQSTKVAYIEKRPMVSDHQLLLSLLNRPVPQDQQMMLAFTRQQDQEMSSMPNYLPSVVPVLLKGEKSESPEARPTYQFSYLINQDKNAIFINGPI